MDTFVIATHNQKKLAELQRILEPLGISAVTAELEEVEETGETFAENAFLKADAACKQTGKPAVADDSGLVVDALDGAPGYVCPVCRGECYGSGSDCQASPGDAVLSSSGALCPVCIVYLLCFSRRYCSAGRGNLRRRNWFFSSWRRWIWI